MCVYMCTCMYVCVIKAFNLGLFTRVRLVCMCIAVHVIYVCVYVHLHVCVCD